MKIAANKVVSIEYTLKSLEGEVLDSTDGDEPMDYLHGADNIVPGLEEALDGKTAGDAVEITVPPEKGYGALEDDMVEVLKRDQFPDGEVEIGMQFQAETDDGPVVLRVIKFDDTSVTVDGNHPLAGQSLCFSVKVIGVRDATKEEEEHGHVHGPEGHHHH